MLAKRHSVFLILIILLLMLLDFPEAGLSLRVRVGSRIPNSMVVLLISMAVPGPLPFGTGEGESAAVPWRTVHGKGSFQLEVVSFDYGFSI